MKETLNRIADIIDDYNTTDIFDGQTLNNQLKQLTSMLYHVETIRTKAHEDFEAVIHNKVNELANRVTTTFSK